MKEIIFKFYEGITVLLPFLVLIGIQKKRGEKIAFLKRKKGVLAAIVFACYVVVVFYLTGAGTIYQFYHMYGSPIQLDQMNLLPFSREIDRVAYMQNVLLFVPFGCLLPFLWKKYDRFVNILLSGFSFSLLIEGSQLLNQRRTDVDDLILNTAGALIGYGCFKILCSIEKHRKGKSQTRQKGCTGRLSKRERQTEKSSWKDGPAFYIAVMFLGHFLLFYEIGMAKILYGIG